VRERRAEVGGVRRRPVTAAGLIELGAANAGHFRKIAGEGRGLPARGVGLKSLSIAARRARVSGSGERCDSLRVALLGYGPEEEVGEFNFAIAVADADDRRHAGVNSGGPGDEGVRPVDVVKSGARRDGACPFEIEIGLDLVAREARIVAVREQLWIVYGQIVARAERANVAEEYVRRAHDGDALPRSVQA